MSSIPDERFFLFLGESDREGATSKLKTAGVAYRKKRLESGTKNWEQILELVESDHLLGVLWKASRDSYERMASDAFQEVRERLLDAMSAKPHVVFVHESFFIGHRYEDEPEPDEYDENYDYWQYYLQPPSRDVRGKVNQLLDQHGITPTPYQTNAEMGVLAAGFIDQHEHNMIFRIYVPAARMWGAEAGKLLSLFRDYLHSVKGLRVRQEQHQTGQGVVYEFYADESVDQDSLASEFADFGSLLQLATGNPEEAARLLASQDVSTRDAARIITRYAKEVRRLEVDLKQDREMKVLSVRHRLESELVDLGETDADWAAINAMVDQAIPRVDGVSSSLGFALPSLLTIENAVVNVRPQLIGQVHGVVAQEITGNQHFGTDASQLLELVTKYGGNQSGELVAAVYELEDSDAKPEGRLAARQKLMGFLFKLMDKVGDGAVAVGVAYLSSKLGI